MAKFIPVNPFELIIFGGTGDLARRKLIPSLYHRFCDKQFDEKSRIIAVSRSKLNREQYLALVKKAYLEFSGSEEFRSDKWDEFSELIDYVSLDVTNDDADNWKHLVDHVDVEHSLRIFYLAMPPLMYAQICSALGESGLASENSRVVLEKPIGQDYASAKIINDGVGKYFDENRIYRIDHYLGKETVQNLIVLRFANVFFEPIWSNEHIDHIQITAAESIGTTGRASYYDKSGALRDMVQNHLLQLLCLSAMEAPVSLTSDDIRAEKIKVLKSLRPITEDMLQTHTVRGQYDVGIIDGNAVQGYLNELKEESEKDASSTETFVAIKAEIDNWRWAGVPIYLRTGKRMSRRFSEIVVQFKHVPFSVFGGDTSLQANRLIIRLQPDESVKLWVEIKEPGAGGMRIKSWPLDLTYDEAFTTRYPDAYERLLMDVVRGNLSLFMRRDEVETAWRWIDRIQAGWRKSLHKVETYPAGSMGPVEASLMLDRDGRKWCDGASK